MTCHHRLIQRTRHALLRWWRGNYYWWHVAIRDAVFLDVLFGDWGTIVANSVVKDTGHAVIVVEPKDSKAQPVDLVKPLEWVAADPSIVTLKPSADGLACEVWPAEPFKAGSTTVTATDPAHPHLAI